MILTVGGNLLDFIWFGTGFHAVKSRKIVGFVSFILFFLLDKKVYFDLHFLLIGCHLVNELLLIIIVQYFNL